MIYYLPLYRRHDLTALPANTSNPLLFDDSTKESTFSSEQLPRNYRNSRTSQVSSTDGHHASISAPSTGIDASREESTTNGVNGTELPTETVPRSPTTAHTAQVSIDGHYSSISEPSTGTVKAEGSVEEASSAIANACTL